MTKSNGILYCSFCGKSQHEVRKLIAGPKVFICDECVELCMNIITEEEKVKVAKKLLRDLGFVIHDPVPETKLDAAKKLLQEQGYNVLAPPPPESSLDKFERFVKNFPGASSETNKAKT